MGNGGDVVTCTGEYALMVALMEDGTVPTMALDFIGTTNRTVQTTHDFTGYDDDTVVGFCELQTQCTYFEPGKGNGYHDDADFNDCGTEEVRINYGMALKDDELSEAIRAGFDRYGYHLTHKLNQLLQP